MDRKEEAAIAGGDQLLGFKAEAARGFLGAWLWASHRPLMCLGFPSCRTMETRQPALGQPLRTPKDPTGLPHLWRGSRNILQPARALGRPGLGAEGLSSPCCPRTWPPPSVCLSPATLPLQVAVASGAYLGGPGGRPGARPTSSCGCCGLRPLHPGASASCHPGTQDAALPNSVNPLMLVTMRPQGRWRAVSMETQTCLGSTGRGGELAAGFSKGLLELQPKRE